MKPFITLIAALSATIIATGAELRLPDIFSDHMVLQQQSKARILGQCGSRSARGGCRKLGSRITHKRESRKRRPLEARNTDRRSRIRAADAALGIRPRHRYDQRHTHRGKYGLPRDSRTWRCPCADSGHSPLEGAAQAIAFSCKYPGIRMATIPKTISYDLQTEVPTEWKISSPENAVNFSATAYFFARNLSDLLNVPVGIICSAYGGSKSRGLAKPRTARKLQNMGPRSRAQQRHNARL